MYNTQNKSPINLFEYQNPEEFTDKSGDFENFLDDIWNTRVQSKSYYDSELTDEDEEDNEIKNSQKFITFLKQGRIKSRKYVGTIIWKGNRINLYPKIFHNSTEEKIDIKTINSNILWWLSYAKKKINFPNFQQSMSEMECDFFEVLIYLFAKYTHDTLENSIYQTYQEVEQELSYIKGRIDWNNYISNNLSTGNWQRIHCVHEPFELDNQFNRIIKYVAKMLYSATVVDTNKQLLGDIIFILDEVTDKKPTLQDCDKIKLNNIFEQFHTVLDYCRLFLSNSVSISENETLELFAFLIPMDVLFEEFVAGFLNEHFKTWYWQYQKSDKYLAITDNGTKVFQLRHDIFSVPKDIIIDTKYKILDSQNESETKKYGVSQTDIYQMVSYAIRRKCKKLFMLYPMSYIERNSDYSKNVNPNFIISDMFTNENNLNLPIKETPTFNIRIAKIPICFQLVNNDFKNSSELARERLKNYFDELFKQAEKTSSKFSFITIIIKLS